jgi:hypothetical protein
MVTPDLERQQRPVRISDVEALAIADIDHRYPLAIDESPVQGAVVDGQPPALIEAQQQVGARDQRMRYSHVGPEVAPHHHIVARGKRPLRTLMPDGQRRRGRCTH